MPHKKNTPTCAGGWWNRQLFTFTRRLHYHKPAAGKKMGKFSPETTSCTPNPSSSPLPPQKIHNRCANDLGELAFNQIGHWGGLSSSIRVAFGKVASRKWWVLLCTHKLLNYYSITIMIVLRGLKGFEITLHLLFRLQFAAVHAYRWAKCYRANRKP